MPISDKNSASCAKADGENMQIHEEKVALPGGLEPPTVGLEGPPQSSETAVNAAESVGSEGAESGCSAIAAESPSLGRRFSNPVDRRAGAKGLEKSGYESGTSAWLLPPVAWNDPLRSIWAKMIARCHDPRSRDYPRYGGRGIAVCPEWRGPLGVRAFVAHIGARPSPQHTVDRVDNSRGYEPGNVRWATWTEQHSNRRDNVCVEHAGRSLTISQWSRETGIARQLISMRIRTGWNPGLAVSTPQGIGIAEAHDKAGLPRTERKRVPHG